MPIRKPSTIMNRRPADFMRERHPAPAARVTLWIAFLATLATGKISAAAEPHQYNVSVDYRLSQLWVEARFSTPVKSVTARSRVAGKYLIDVRDCFDSREIRLRNRRMMLPDEGIECLNYTVNLERAAREHRSQRFLASDNIIVSPSLWLWRPEVTANSEIDIRFQLPEQVRVSVPWRPLGKDAYRLHRSPESSNASVVFGNFHEEEIHVAGARLRVSMLNGRKPFDRGAISNWVRATATDVSLVYGRFPNPSPQVVVIPVDSTRSSSAVPFGRVIRDGGETVELLVNVAAPPDAFFSDWTATHEFSHLMLPYIGGRHRWVAEGFAQYYQNVLLARAGAYDQQHAWQKLHEGFERGRRSRPEMSPNEAADGRARNGLMKIYWSGAALALIADVDLRERSDGRETLDKVLDRFQDCCLPSPRVWSGPELFGKLDSLTDFPIFMQLYRRYANTAGFPDTRPTFARLGITVSHDQVRLRKNGELIHVRDNIIRTDSDAAAWRQSLAGSQDSQRTARSH
ncbi:MAG: hypothetical protein KJO31_02340 [Gammaproteobacteria bacterium]|nr:hypothetical protein [Gammaproteobacteria bacterium]